MTWAAILVGILLILAGRKLFWLFVGGMGFVVGWMLAAQFFQNITELVRILVSVAFGLAGVFLAQILQRLAVMLAGIVAGAFALETLVKLLFPGAVANTWALYIIGGIIGAALVLSFFEWALIILSSLGGATLVIQALNARPLPASLLFLVLLAVGIAVQGGTLERIRRFQKQR